MANRLFVALFILLVNLPIAVSSTAAESPATAPAGTSPSVDKLVEETRDSIVVMSVEGRDGGRTGMGTGFVISSDGLIATNLHVIGEARPIQVRFHDGRTFEVTDVHASDRHLDLAIVRIAAKNLRPLELLGDQEVSQGTSIVALGNPMGLRHSVVSGVVSGHREIDGRRMIQVAMPIEPGNSGGPIIDLKKRVLGIVTMKSAVTANLGFAMEVAALKRLMEKPNPVPMSQWKTIGSLNPRDWTPLFGANWKKRAGLIVVSELGEGFGGRSLCLWNRRDLPNEGYDVGVFVKLDDERGAAGLAFDADGGEKHYGFYPSGGRLRLTRFDGPTVYSWKVLQEVESEHYRPGRWNHLKVRIEPDQLTCFVNDQMVVQREISAKPEGRAGLVKFRQTSAQFKQFQLQNEIPLTQLSAERRKNTAEQLAAIKIDNWTPSQDVERLTGDPRASITVLQEKIIDLEQQTANLRRLIEDVHTHDVCNQLAAIFHADEINLVRAALLISKLDNQELDVEPYVVELEEIAKEVSGDLPKDAGEQERLEKLNEHLFQQRGFHGSRTDYYHAANSYFDRVLDDREGLPITLSVLYMELGRRLGLNIEGVGLPGHFVVRFSPSQGDAQLIDVFDRGRILPLDEAKRMVVQSTGSFRPEFLEASSQKAIIVRMLRNLLNIAQRDADPSAMLRYLEAMVAVDPAEPSHRGMRAVVRQQTGRQQAAAEDLQWFLDTQPAGIDLDRIREMKKAFGRQ